MSETSVVICAYTTARWASLVAAVDSCRNQTAPPGEVIVVIDHNDDLLDRARRELGGVRVLASTSTPGLSGARNCGVRAAKGAVVAFLDDDAFADRAWLEHLTAPLVDPLVAGVGGWIVPQWESAQPAWLAESFLWTLGCSYRGLPESGATIRNPIGANMALRRDVVVAAGGFASQIGRIGATPLGCEETELCIRYRQGHEGHSFVLSREALVHHLVPASRASLRYVLRRCWAEGLSKAVVSGLVGAASGLAAERQQLVSLMTRELWTNLRTLRRSPSRAVARTLFIAGATAITVAGYLRGRWGLRRSAAADRSFFDFSSVDGPLGGGGEPNPTPHASS